MVKRKRDKLKMKLYHFKSGHGRRGFKIEASYDDLIKKILATDGYCTICGKHVGIYNLTGDMVEPSRKKLHYIDDIQFICRICNSAKNNKESFISIGFDIEGNRVSWYSHHENFRRRHDGSYNWFPHYKSMHSKNICLTFNLNPYSILRMGAINWKRHPRGFHHGMKTSDF